MAREKRYFRLGLLLLSGFGLIIAGALAFGLRAAFRDTIPAETYFDESVEGLAAGSSVKYRGVEVGQVADIGFVAKDYAEAPVSQRSYVLVRMKLFKDVAGNMALDKPVEDVPLAVDRGLRIRRTTQGLTGVTYLEIDFLDPARNPAPPISWHPDSIYIPSAPSTMSRLEAAISDISKTLENFAAVDFQSLAATVNGIMAQVEATLKDANVANLGELLAQDMAEARKILGRVDELLASPTAKSIIPDLSATMESVRKVAKRSEKDLPDMVSELRRASESIGHTAQTLNTIFANPSVQAGMDRFPKVMDNVAEAAQGFAEAAARLSQLTANFNELTIREREDLSAIVENLRATSRSLRDLTEEAGQNPSRMILGEPPRPVKP